MRELNEDDRSSRGRSQSAVDSLEICVEQGETVFGFERRWVASCRKR